MRFLLAPLLFFCATAATAEQNPLDRCTSHDEMVAQLADEYDESAVASGINRRHLMMEIFVSKDGSTWTIIMTSASGFSCVMDYGEDWQPKPIKRGDGV